MIPITLVTGFLGSGKTTLLNNLIIGNPDKKIVVIENEFGEVGIDGALMVDLDAQIFELSNGCICCNLSEDLQETLLKLLDVAVKPEHLIIETTGIADPSPIIASLLSDEIIQSNFKIDSVITLIDGLFIVDQLKEHPQCYKQIALGNYIIVNKIATIPKPELEKIVAQIAQLNPEATIYATNFSEVKDLNLLELDLFDKTVETAVDELPQRSFTMLNNSPYIRKVTLKENTHQEIQSINIRQSQPLDIIKFDTWLKALMGNHFGNIFRVKGFVFLEDFDFRITVQGVQNIYVTEKGTEVSIDQVKESILVFIGRNLNNELLQEGLNLCKYIEDSELDFTKIYDNIEAIQENFLK
jgi:G3E family GTPase